MLGKRGPKVWWTEREVVRSLASIDFKVQPRKQFPWLDNRLSYADTAIWSMFDDLGGDRERLLNKRRSHLSCDAFLPTYNCIFEYDERQHFTSARQSTLRKYHAAHAGFPAKLFEQHCSHIWDVAEAHGAPGYRRSVPEFDFPASRHCQRAIFDMARDQLALANGLNPTVRVGYFELPRGRGGPFNLVDELRGVLMTRITSGTHRT